MWFQMTLMFCLLKLNWLIIDCTLLSEFDICASQKSDWIFKTWTVWFIASCLILIFIQCCRWLKLNSSINEGHLPKLNWTFVMTHKRWSYYNRHTCNCTVYNTVYIYILVYFIHKQLINSTTLTATTTIGEEAYSLIKQQ